MGWWIVNFAFSFHRILDKLIKLIIIIVSHVITNYIINNFQIAPARPIRPRFVSTNYNLPKGWSTGLVIHGCTADFSNGGWFKGKGRERSRWNKKSTARISALVPRTRNSRVGDDFRGATSWVVSQLVPFLCFQGAGDNSAMNFNSTPLEAFMNFNSTPFPRPPPLVRPSASVFGAQEGGKRSAAEENRRGWRRTPPTTL